MSSSQNTFASNQPTFVTRPNATWTMNVGRQSPNSSSTMNTTRIVAPRPFYRSQITPDRFESSTHDPRTRRYSGQQINGKDPFPPYCYCMCMLHEQF